MAALELVCQKPEAVTVTLQLLSVTKTECLYSQETVGQASLVRPGSVSSANVLQAARTAQEIPLVPVIDVVSGNPLKPAISSVLMGRVLVIASQEPPSAQEIPLVPATTLDNGSLGPPVNSIVPLEPVAELVCLEQ